MKVLLALVACLLVTGCMNSAPCEDKWVTVYSAEGTMYVKESSACISIEASKKERL